jgi:hypothetical protein
MIFFEINNKRKAFTELYKPQVKEQSNRVFLATGIIKKNDNTCICAYFYHLDGWDGNDILRQWCMDNIPTTYDGVDIDKEFRDTPVV